MMNLLNKKYVTQIVCGLFLVFLFMTVPANAAGLLTPKKSGLPELEIREHKVNVIIEDGYAITTVEQVFFNAYTQDMEAIYSFPVPQKGSIAEFTMWIDGKPINGEVLEKKKAREVYEEQKAQNRNTGITEKNEYKTFEISVYPVRANQETKIRLSYFQPAHVDTGIGRYIYPLEDGGVDDQALSFWMTNEKVTGDFTFDLFLRSAYPIDHVRLPNHPQAQIKQNADEWHVHFDNHMNTTVNVNTMQDALTLNNHGDEEESGLSEVDPNFRLDTDIVVYFRHAENLPGAVDLVAYKGKDENRGTFMLTITPGVDLKPITGGRDWAFILDISGSMQGKYATLAEGVNRALKKMSVNDRFRIILFNDSARELTSGYTPATAENVDKYINEVSNVLPDKGTNLYAGLADGLKSLDTDRTTTLILVTDGVANVGVTQQKSFIDLIKKYDVRLFTFVMGNSANLPLLDALTRVSNGAAVSVSNSDDIIGKIMEIQSKVNFQALHGADLKISGVKTADLMPKKIGSVYRGDQLIIFGHYFDGGLAKVELKGKISGEEKIYSTEFNFPDVSELNPEIERLWAYAMIEQLTQEMDDFGEQADIKQSITDIGVEYSLVTDYTSMVVVEEEVFKELGIDQRNKNRLTNEYNMRQHRSTQPVKNNRVDAQTPMYTSNRPTFAGGAGAFDPVSIAIFSPLLWGLRKKKKNTLKDEKC